MEINSKVFEKLAQLSALKINKEEEQELKQFLMKALSHFERIKNIDTKNIPALTSPLQPALHLREDECVDFPDKEKLLEQAPKKQGALVKTPAIV